MKPREEWFRLCEALCNDAITAEEHERLKTILKESAEARQFYRDYLDVQAGLEQPMTAELAATDEKVAQLSGHIFSGWRAIAAAAALVMLGFFVSQVTENPPEVVQVEKPDQPVVLETNAEPEAIEVTFLEPVAPPKAVLTRAIDVEWAHPRSFRATVGEPITEKHLRIASGIVEIAFGSGAVVSVEGPARFVPHTAMSCRINGGKLAANCPPSARGFTVRFKGGRVVDLGTEFAIDSKAQGRAQVHVLSGEVMVAVTDDQEKVLKERSLKVNTAVELNAEAMTEIAYDEKPFSGLKRSALIESQPIKLQFDLGHRAGLYHGTNSPAHAEGLMFAHENNWTQIVGDQSGVFVMADGNICPHPIRLDYGHGNGDVDWDAKPVDPTGRVHNKAEPFFNTALCQDHRPWDFDLGLRVSGLPAGTYRVYALCRSIRRPTAAYDVSFGVNLDRQLDQPLEMPPMENLKGVHWEAGLTYAVADITVNGPDDRATFITRYDRERSLRTTPHHGRSLLLGLQIVEIRRAGDNG